MLDSLDKKKNPFKVPENYFENFNAEIMSKLPEKQIQKRKIVPLWKKVVPWTAAAAVFCGVIFSTGILNKTTSDPVPVTSSALASSEEEDYYLFLEDEVVRSQYKEIMYNN
ncbi:hypothetical protein JGH11_12115 [Dysgonomonas sp. Marseille-P4677]|uniref:hypothetical protein n=1 Tax=Dysgonomonas sp. Marseille-P4677 TaxID=2364790 RepID=UPI0019138D82|nr:hypothetical protein [Dysgonomonas sp. Marseille-P4677]MBK5721616.1 hypothetical protein [Dysgonomonas sp. Marseille-P4677]